MTFGIDAHQHYCNPSRGDYGWIPAPDTPAGKILARPHLPKDLEPQAQHLGVEKTVLVQAAPTVQETEYLLGIADCTDSVSAVVGWVDFEDPSALEQLQRFATHPKFRGVRPVIQNIADDDWMLRDDVQWAYRAICDLDLTFDALGFPRHIENFRILLSRYRSMRSVIDHCMKPRIHDAATDPSAYRDWAEGMARLAGETGACCKLSGLVTEAGEDWSEAKLRPFSDHVLRYFGAERTMWGSDWPVCLLRASYSVWRHTAEALTEELNDDDRAKVFGGTAARFYRIS